jgi:hypothetical protein
VVLAPLGWGHREFGGFFLAVGWRVGRYFVVGDMVLGGNRDSERFQYGFVVGSDHREGAPALLPLLDLADDDVVEVVGSQGHAVDGLDDLIVAFLLELIVLSEELQEMREAVLLPFQHDAFQLAFEVELLEDGVSPDRTHLCHLVAKLLLVRDYFLGSELDAEELDDGAQQVVDLLEEEVDGQRQDLQVGHSRSLLLLIRLLWAVRPELRRQLVELLPQEVVLPLQLLDLQQQELLLVVRTDVLLAGIQTHQRSLLRFLAVGNSLGLLGRPNCDGDCGSLWLFGVSLFRKFLSPHLLQ